MTPRLTTILLALAMAGPAWAETVNGSDFYVIDGDTVEFHGERIRISNIDAPEIGKFDCEFERQLGLAARDVMTEALAGQQVTITRETKTNGDIKLDRYRRTLATLANREGDIGRQMISAHVALPWAYGAKAKAWRKAQWCGEEG
ncbi:thermonuclease family protein [Labrys neptuniae]